MNNFVRHERHIWKRCAAHSLLSTCTVVCSLCLCLCLCHTHTHTHTHTRTLCLHADHLQLTETETQRDVHQAQCDKLREDLREMEGLESELHDLRSKASRLDGTLAEIAKLRQHVCMHAVLFPLFIVYP